ncbi:MAG TPA: sugar transferase [Ignavibacteria bacterium]|nr:sugar transferase [Ignavibacteria bacterium]HMR38789.1 sugar transferase [Ignavibacteria bacterium]
MLKRIFDIIFSSAGLLLLLPVFIVVAIIVKLDSKGPVFYKQSRVGKNNKDFRLYKFRTMDPDSDKKGLLTVGGKDPRITRSGYYLRKFKLDELPQLINVLIGEMSFVGPRPEVRKYVDIYTEEQIKVLDVSPGITDVASIKYRNENELLEKADDPEKYYIEIIMPDKIDLNLEYINQRSVFKDVKVILKTLTSVFS